ncbi:5-oxoprolinase subunit PxpA [uncultured Maribacter sp.]|uniref:5-oxoprolinase subunit PxpA n=1 Tax=uncultured Maribacter sp. TaxID=431308 RepID=UPI00262DE60B|nr:5-oxoprolinase subunit PxpA [uncultured Maribacter sp.]
MNVKYIDINCDVGEGVANESDLFPFLTSCNVACGGHFGTKETMKTTVDLAVKYGVKIGVHPSYPDKENFGRASINISKNAFVNSIKEQISNFLSVLNEKKVVLHHIKPHGALYNDLVKNKELAQTFLESILAYKEKALVYSPYNSVIAKEALKQGFKVKYEAFADRNYNSDLSLVSRKQKNALISNSKSVLEHISVMLFQEKVKVMSGDLVAIQASTFCVHGDSSNTLDILTYLSKELPKLNILKSV